MMGLWAFGLWWWWWWWREWKGDDEKRRKRKKSIKKRVKKYSVAYRTSHAPATSVTSVGLSPTKSLASVTSAFSLITGKARTKWAA